MSSADPAQAALQLGSIIDRLTPDERCALGVVVESGEPIDRGYLAAELVAEQPHGAHPDRVIDELVRRGLVVRLGGERLAVAPARATLLRQLIAHHQRVVPADIVRGFSQPKDFHKALLLGAIDAQPPRTTRSQGLHKVDLDRLVALFGEAFGPDLTQVIAGLQSASLLAERDGALIVRWGRARAWAALREEERVRFDLRDVLFYCPYLGHALARLLFEPLDGPSVTAGDAEPLPGGWVSGTALAAYHRRVRYTELARWRPPDVAQLLSEWRIVEERLAHCSVVERAELRQGGLAYRLSRSARAALSSLRPKGSPGEPGQEGTAGASPVGAAQPAGVADAAAGATPEALCHVQPTFEILLPPEVPTVEVLELGRVAEVRTVHAVATLQITAARVRATASRGATADELVAILKRAARHGLPASVERQVIDWAGGATRVEFVEALLLRVDPARAAELRVDPRVAHLLFEELAPGLFAVDPARRAQLGKTLVARGLTPSPTVVRYPPEDAATSLDADELEGALAAVTRTVGQRMPWQSGQTPGPSSPPTPQSSEAAKSSVTPRGANSGRVRPDRD